MRTPDYKWGRLTRTPPEKGGVSEHETSKNKKEIRSLSNNLQRCSTEAAPWLTHAFDQKSN